MIRFALPLFSALAMALSPAAASAQGAIPAASPLLTTASLAAERAVPDLASSSSSSAPDLFDSPAQSSIGGQAPAAVNRPEGSTHPFSGLAAGVKLGLAGIGFDVATPLVPGRLNLRGGASFFSYSTTVTTDDINIDGSLKFRNAAMMVDWFPFHGTFRLSGGASIYNNTGLSGSLSVPAGQNFTLGGISYYSQPGDPVNGTGSFIFGGNKVAPRVTLGFGNMLPEKGHLRLTSEVSFQYISQPAVVYTLSGNGCTGYTGVTYTGCAPIPQSSITAEQNELQNDLTDLRFYPIVSIGLSYKIH